MSQQTSLLAFQEVQKNLGERQLQIYKTLQKLGEATNTMIARKYGVPINTVTPRIFELRRMGLVIYSYEDICPITNRKAIFWRCVFK